MRRNLWAFGLVLATVLVTTSVPAQPPSSPPSAPPPQGERPARAGRPPHMHAAVRDLERAEKQLEKAAHHYDGHRAKALELVKQAEKELQEGLKWAEAHPEAFATGQKKP
jgi:hypothetical protein